MAVALLHAVCPLVHPEPQRPETRKVHNLCVWGLRLIAEDLGFLELIVYRVCSLRFRAYSLGFRLKV